MVQRKVCKLTAASEISKEETNCRTTLEMSSELTKSRQVGFWSSLRHFLAFQFCFQFPLYIYTDLATAVSIPQQDIAIRKRFIAPDPIYFGPSEAWQGNDGPWSTFAIQVGTPVVEFRVDISIGGQETWVVSAESGCGKDPNGDQCGEKRGRLFNRSISQTWKSTAEIWNNTGVYALGGQIDSYLGLGGRGRYGFDTIGIPFSDGTALSINQSTVAEFATRKFYMGQFGVSPLSTNFTGGNKNAESRPSFFSLLKESNKIPSLSYSFTAGSYGRSMTRSNALGSFIFGGYDASLIGPNSISFAFGPETGRELLVNIRAILKSNGTDETTDLLQTPSILAALDSSQPNIWLPESACKQFERGFGLVWNETAKLYLVNETLHDTLLKENASVTFRLGQEATDEEVDIVFPYSAFDLTAKWPLVPEGNSSYFPLKRAANSTQYTLGRAFLQEAYLITDWERRNFSLSQRSWNSSSAQNIVSIKSVNDSSTSSGGNSAMDPASESGNKTLSGGAIAGISIGCVAFASIVIGLIGVFAWTHSKKEKTKSLNSDDQSAEKNATAFSGPELEGHQNMTHEIDSNRGPHYEMDGENQEHRCVEGHGTKPVELDGDVSDFHVHELVGDEPTLELAANEPSLELAGNELNLEERRSGTEPIRVSFQSQ